MVSTLCRLQCSWERGKPVWETSKCNVASESNISGASGPTETVHNHPVMVYMASRERNKPIQDGGDADAPLWLREAI